MKAEERHELQTNDLESFLYYRLPHYLKQYGSYILLVLALMLLGYQLWGRYQDSKLRHVAEAWQGLQNADEKAALAFNAARQPEAYKDLKPENPVGIYRDILAQYSDVKTAAAQAHIKLGKFYRTFMLSGLSDVGGFSASFDQALNFAQGEYETVIKEFPEETSAVAEAKLGMATVLEDRRHFDEAQKIYEEMSAPNGAFANTPYAAEAGRRLARLPEIENAVKFGPSDPEWIKNRVGGAATQVTRPTTGPATTAAAATAPAKAATSLPAESQPKK